MQQHSSSGINNANSNVCNNNSNYDYSGTIGCWGMPLNSSSGSRSGWSSNDGNPRSDGPPDDGTAIWGNPSHQKTGIDWTEKEMLLNPPKANSNDSEKRIQKTEPSISSINGTEAWGAPQQPPISVKNNNNIIANSINSNDSQSQLKNDNIGNNEKFGNIDAIGWASESSSSLVTRATNVTTNEKSSPLTESSVWNSLGSNKQRQQTKASDWLNAVSKNVSNIGGGGGGVATGVDVGIRRSDDANLCRQIGQQTVSSVAPTGQFDNVTDAVKAINLGIVNGSNMSCIGAGSDNKNMNDLKLSAIYPNDLIDPPNRQSSGSLTSNNRQSQFDSSAAYANNTVSPSRDLLKQMVHQIQLAVQAGHLNAQILNQPMSTPTLQLLYQLLQEINTLHQLQELQQHAGKSNSNSQTNVDLEINRITHNISLLHKAITQQQAKNEQQQIGESNIIKQKQQQISANNYSYANISKLSTNQRVPSSANNIISNMDSFNKSSLVNSLKNDSNSDTLRSVQGKFNPSATFDKNLLPSMSTSSSADNVLGNNNKAITATSDYSTKGHNFISGNPSQQASAKGSLLSAQSSASSSSSTSSTAAWSIFNSSGDFNPQQGWSSQLRISSNQVSQQDQQFGSFDISPEFGLAKGWCNSSLLNNDCKEPRGLSQGGNIARPNSAIAPSNNIQKQLNGTNTLNNRESALFCDWNNDSDLDKRNHFGPISGSDTGNTTSTIGSAGGLSLQSNPWLFLQGGQINNGNLMDNLSNKNGRNTMSSNKLDEVNGLINKSNLPPANGRNRTTSSALFDWSGVAASALEIQNMNSGDNSKQLQPTLTSSSSSNLIGSSSGRPGPPPGLLGANYGQSAPQPQIGAINSLFDVDIVQPRESASRLWSGAWLD